MIPHREHYVCGGGGGGVGGQVCYNVCREGEGGGGRETLWSRYGNVMVALW